MNQVNFICGRTHLMLGFQSSLEKNKQNVKKIFRENTNSFGFYQPFMKIQLKLYFYCIHSVLVWEKKKIINFFHNNESLIPSENCLFERQKWPDNFHIYFILSIINNVSSDEIQVVTITSYISIPQSFVV